jgi:hypothetical protein
MRAVQDGKLFTLHTDHYAAHHKTRTPTSLENTQGQRVLLC